MRTSVGLAVVIAAGLAVGLSFSGAQLAHDRRTSPRERMVYVDRGRLMELHPAWEALSEMKVAFAEVRGTCRLAEGAFGRRQACSRGALFLTLPEARTEVRRQMLETEATQGVVRALQQSESDMRAALAMRLNSMRSTMMESASASRMARAKEIECDASRAADAIDRDYGSNRLRAELKVSALTSSAGHIGVDEATAQAKLASATAALAAMEASNVKDKNQRTAAAQSKIDALKKEDSAKIDAKLSEYELRENSRIEKTVADARNQILCELSSFDVQVRGRKTAGKQFGSLGGNADPSSCDGCAGDQRGLSAMKAMADRLEGQIQQDVDRAVSSIASKEGVKVTYTSRGRDVEDATRKFTDLMRKFSWRTFGPVLSEARGS